VLRRFEVAILRLCALTGSLPALDRRFIAPPIRSGTLIVAGENSADHEIPGRWRTATHNRDLRDRQCYIGPRYRRVGLTWDGTSLDARGRSPNVRSR